MWTTIEEVRQAMADKQLRALAKAFDVGKPKQVTVALALTPEELATLVRNDVLAAKLGAVAHGLMVKGKFVEALKLFDPLVEGEPSELHIFANALYAVAEGNNHLGLSPTRARRYLERARPKGPKNPFIFYNAACVAAELGDRDGAIADVRDAVRFGFSDLDGIKSDEALKPLLADRRFGEAFTDPALLAERATWIEPPGMVALRRLGTDNGWDSDEVDFEMRGAFASPAETQAWFESWTGKKRPGADRLRLFAEDGSGGQVAIWLHAAGAPLDRQPIVFFGSEGALGVVARDLADFFRLMADSLAPGGVIENGAAAPGAPLAPLHEALLQLYPSAKDRTVAEVFRAAAPLTPLLSSFVGR